MTVILILLFACHEPLFLLSDSFLFICFFLFQNRTKQVLCVPLRIDPQSPTLGVLHLVNTRHGHAFSPESEQMVVTFATQIAIAIAAVHLNENVKTVKMTRFIKRYRNLLLTKTFNTWYGVWNNAKRLRNVRGLPVCCFSVVSFLVATMNQIKKRGTHFSNAIFAIHLFSSFFFVSGTI